MMKTKNKSDQIVSCERSSKIIVSPKTRIGKTRLKIIKDAFEFFLNDLNLTNVSCRFNGADFFERNVFGFCPDSQTILIKNKKDLFSVLSTIAHELRHCFQWESKTMGWNETDQTRVWLGRVITHEETTMMDYWETPWEEDAIEYEQQMESVIEDFIFKSFDHS